MPEAEQPPGWPDKITVAMAARCLRKSNQAVRVNIENGRLPIGRALQGSGNRMTYVITPEKLREEAGEARFNEFFGIARGPHECEAVAAGTAGDLRSANMGIWREKIVDRLWLDVWPDKNTPVLAILTGEKET